MKGQLVNERNGLRTFVLVFDKGDEAMNSLREFARNKHLIGSNFTGIGAFRDVVLGYFDREKKEYRRIPVNEQVEVLALTGDITMEDKQPKIHAHVVIGKSDGTAMGGHLLQAHVWPTLELTVVDTEKYLIRRPDPETGLALIDLKAVREVA